MKNNITTRQGDHGTTSLADGTIVTKNDQKIEACGTLDELNCHVGMLLTMNLPEEYSGMLNTIQRRLFAIGASMSGTTYPKDFPTEMHIMQMEQFINTAPTFHGFILPGGHPSAAQCHICRAVCRPAAGKARRRDARSVGSCAAGRRCCRTDLVPYLNRLSDFFFALALKLNIFYGVAEKNL